MVFLYIEPGTEQKPLAVHQGLTPVNEVLLGSDGRFTLFAAIDVVTAGMYDKELAHARTPIQVNMLLFWGGICFYGQLSCPLAGRNLVLRTNVKYTTDFFIFVVY